MVENSLLPAVWKVPQAFRDRLGTKAGRQRVMQAEGHLLIVLHAPPSPDDDDRRGRFFWRQPDGQWSSDSFGSGPTALGKHLDEYTAILEQNEQQDDAAESAEDYFTLISTLAPLKRAARHQHEAMQQARQLCTDDHDLISLRDRTYQIERTAELLFDDSKNGLDFSVARRAEEQARSSKKMAIAAHRLNGLAAFFFPIATVMTIFGANLDHGLEHLVPPYPFLICAGLGLVSGIVLTSMLSRISDDSAV